MRKVPATPRSRTTLAFRSTKPRVPWGWHGALLGLLSRNINARCTLLHTFWADLSTCESGKSATIRRKSWRTSGCTSARTNRIVRSGWTTGHILPTPPLIPGWASPPVKWEGNTLTVYTTHMKAGYLRRNGLPESDQATLIEHFMRHGDYLVHVSEVTDPATLTEPFVRSQVFRRISEEGQNWLYPCESVVEIANQPRGAVPNFLPGENPFVAEFAKKYGIPLAATLGGAETMYPEFQRKMKEMDSPEK